MPSPHGGTLVDLLVTGARAEALAQRAAGWPSWTLSPRQLCDLELLLSGGFSPLTGFLGRADYESVCERMRLEDGALWPIPVTLDVPESVAAGLAKGEGLALRDVEGTLLAVLHVREVWRPDREAEAASVLGTRSGAHPGVRALRECTHDWYVGGPVEGLRPPEHHDFRALRLTPAGLRREFRRLGWERVVAFQTRNPMHRAHVELALRAAREACASLLIHPVVGVTRPGDVDAFTRVRCYQAVLPRFPAATTRLALLPLAMRMAGPSEALWHGIIRKNHGCTHLIVGRDHAGPGADLDGRPFYPPYEAQELLRAHEEELGLRVVPYGRLSYRQDLDRYVAAEDGAADAGRDVSGADVVRRLVEGREIPSWLSFPEVVEELRKSYPPRARQGFTVFFTGLSGAGKSTLANALLVKLQEGGGRAVTLLDGDVVRRLLSSELGFSREHRELNIRRIGFVAAAVTRSGGVALCAAIAPQDAVRREVRAMVAPGGGFLLVHVATPLAVCEARDRKGHYTRARAGLLPEFTGISSPYEPPTDADLVIDTTALTPEEAAQRILSRLERDGYLPAPPGTRPSSA